MEQTFLIAGNQAKLNSDIAQEILSQGHRAFVTLEPETESPSIPAGLESNLHYVEWNRRSPISARFVLLQAINKEIDIDHAILLLTPRNVKEAIHELASAAVEEKVDFDIKGYLFLLKELINYFLKRKAGSISFVVQNTGPDVLPPCDALLQGSFYGLAESMFSFYENECFALRGVETRLSSNRQIAEYLIQLITENAPRSRGKWIKYTGKNGLFSFGH